VLAASLTDLMTILARLRSFLSVVHRKIACWESEYELGAARAANTR
jgi:hypothetical protein